MSSGLLCGEWICRPGHSVRWKSSTLERLGDAVSHIIVGTATHRIVLNLKRLEDITSQNRFLIMDLTVHHRGNDKPISSYDFIRHVVPLTYQFRVPAAQCLVRDVVTAVNAYLNAAAVLLLKDLAITVFGFALRYQKIRRITDRVFKAGIRVGLVVVLRGCEGCLTDGHSHGYAQTNKAD